MPSDISASAMVSQPFSSAKVSASASARACRSRTARWRSHVPAGLRGGQNFGRSAKGGGEQHREDRERDRAVEMGDAGVERDQDRERREHRRRRPHHRMRRAERPCARKPATPKPAAKIAAITRCSVTAPSVAVGPMPGSGPPGSTSMSGLARTAHSANTMKTVAAAAPSAPVGRRRAPGDEQTAGHQQREGDQREVGMRTRSARSASRRTDRPRASPTTPARSGPSAGGPNMKPQTTSSAASTKPAITWKACGATIEGPHRAPGRSRARRTRSS